MWPEPASMVPHSGEPLIVAMFPHIVAIIPVANTAGLSTSRRHCRPSVRATQQSEDQRNMPRILPVRLGATLGVISLAFMATLVSSASPARALTNKCNRVGDLAVDAPTPYLSTGYGPVTFGVRVSGSNATPGFYSPLTGGFSATGGTAPVVSRATNKVDYFVSGADGRNGFFCGFTSVSTPYGHAIFGIQWTGIDDNANYRQGRSGNLNLANLTFYPDGSALYNQA
jgi:hypothetical protein